VTLPELHEAVLDLSVEISNLDEGDETVADVSGEEGTLVDALKQLRRGIDGLLLGHDDGGAS
jgi:hypothetical protein